MEIIKGKPAGLSEDKIYGALTRDVADEIGANIVSIWAFDNKKSAITQVYYCDSTERQQTQKIQITRADQEPYFDSILENVYLIANDAYNHPSIKSLVDDYIASRGVKSLLDYVIYRNLEPVGVICCEATERRNWTMQDIAKVRAITVAMSFEFEDQIFPIPMTG